MKRRTFLLTGAAATIALPAMADTAPAIKVVKSPTCGCCTAWVDHVRQAGFQVEVQNVEQDALYALKDKLQIAPELAVATPPWWAIISSRAMCRQKTSPGFSQSNRWRAG